MGASKYAPEPEPPSISSKAAVSKVESQARAAADVSGIDRVAVLKALFEAVDADHDGRVPLQEFTAMFDTDGLKLLGDLQVDDDVKKDFLAIDTDGDGEATKDEFLKAKLAEFELDDDMLFECCCGGGRISLVEMNKRKAKFSAGGPPPSAAAYTATTAAAEPTPLCQKKRRRWRPKRRRRRAKKRHRRPTLSLRRRRRQRQPRLSQRPSLSLPPRRSSPSRPRSH
jgi:hypothetical protein